MNRAEELRRAVKQANLPLSVVVTVDALLSRADWATGLIPEKHQPRSVRELARWAGISTSVCETALNTGRDFGWIERHSPRVLFRGLSTTYQVRMGRKRPEREPMSEAERARRYRQRKKQRTGSPVTERSEQPERHASAGTNDRHEQVRKPYLKNVTKDHLSPQVMQWAPVGGASGGPEPDDLVLCRVCNTPMDRVLPAAGYTAHPCCNPDEVPRRMRAV
jgi:hypothetical protein